VPAEILHNERELFLRIAAGDQTAFCTLFNHYKNKVYSISWKLTGIQAAAEDVVQEVFLKLWTNKTKLPEIENFNAYLSTVTCNHIYNMARKVSYEHTYLKDMLAKEFSNNSDTLNAVNYNELLNLFHMAVAQLPPQQRRVYQLSREEGLKYEEIAQRLNLSRQTVKSYMKIAILSVKTYLQNHGVAIDLPVLILIGAPALFAQA